ncbi:VWA domain-containing protein [Mycobacterium sp. NPDC003323]
MTDAPDQLRLLATFVAGRSLKVGHAGVPHTDGQTVFVSAGAPLEHQRREMLLQSALLGAGSLAPDYVKAIRGRRRTARRYLYLEGRRALGELAERLPLAAAILPDGPPLTTRPAESLAAARGRAPVPDPPDWFGDITPGVLIRTDAGAGTAATDTDLTLRFDLEAVLQNDGEDGDDGDDGDEPSGNSKLLKLFEAPVTSAALSDTLRKLFGGNRSNGDDSAGGDLRVGSVRRAAQRGVNARPAPTPIVFTDHERPGAAVGVGGALFPEWDVHHGRYRPDWCRVVDFPLATDADITAGDVAPDPVLRSRLSRVGLGPKRLRGRSDGDDLDTEALTALWVDLQSGYSPPENVYVERRKLERNLGVLILVDASGSVTDADPDGLAVHEHQCRAAARIAATLEDLGDRVAVYAFRSQGRSAVHLPAVKTFDQRFGAVARARLNQLQPSGYTRLGAAIRGAGQILKNQAGTPNRLLVVLSDGYPYDNGYEGRYAEADAHSALGELRADGVACLCLSIGVGNSAAAIRRVFGSACNAAGSSLAELSPRMDELFGSALRELARSR